MKVAASASAGPTPPWPVPAIANSVAKLYSEWVKTYADPEFEALAVQLEALLDLHAVDSEAVRANYRRAMELELGFFAAHI